ncbi:type I restriction endonuclease subunit R, EcoR124 family [[Eubacterium] hominis]
MFFKTAWEQRKLSTICSMHARIGWQNLRTSEFLDTGDYYLITGTDFDNGRVNLDNCHYVDKSRYEQDTKIQIQNGSILITKDGTLGKVAFVEGLDKPATLNAGVFNVEITKNFVDNKYLFQYLKAPFLMDYVDKKATGGTIKHLNQNILVDFPIAMPKVEEQRLIGEYFSHLDHLITLHQRKIQVLEQMKKAFLSNMNVEINNKIPQKESENMTFKYEADFEEALIKVLIDKGWEDKVIKHPTEKELIRNWANILYDNNRGIDQLNNFPLTDGEMQQILEQIINLKTPLKLNGFINGKTVAIKRDNPNDTIHFGKEISLKIYDRREIAAGQSRYQIVQQPVFSSKSKILNDRRGDLILLINGMPLFHIELKRSGIPVSQAYNQIEKYAHEGIYSGLFSLIQIFVAMNPDETRYFANPGPEGKFNPDYYFQWEDFNNEPINNWKDIASSLLSIPMAHQLIGFYTVADNSDGVLKVMRSYQFYAASAISDKVSKTKWDEKNQRGGFIWHTTGSGKTMTSFKSAQLIANSNDADKVVFLTDRIELGTQSLKEYRAFADEDESVQATENTYVLISKLKSTDPADTLIVTSIQKMSNIKDEEGGLNSKDIEIINAKRLVFIVDEAHRSTFGDMLITIKSTFSNAIFFGFTGTPIHDENQKKKNTTTNVFGNELHRYSIADGIRDKNVLGFDTYKVLTFKDSDLRRVVALEKAKAESVDDAINDPQKSKIYYKYLDSSQVKMAGEKKENAKYEKGIEDYIPISQYRTKEHQNKVVEDISEKWKDLSHSSKFHAIFATSSIPEAIEYYRLIKEKMPELKTTCLFDPNIDNNGGIEFKEEGLVEIIKDYNKLYNQEFTIATHAAFKKDISLRLAHKEVYKFIERSPKDQLDLLIVVDQMLTGFDSKWVNTLYMDKILEYENIIQAFSRTNRLFGPEKPFGTIRYYRKPHTMEQNIKKAVKLYSGDKPIGLFVEKLPENLNKLNEIYVEISGLFANSGVENFNRLPEDKTVIAKFSLLFRDFNSFLEAAKIQGFNWRKSIYDFHKEECGKNFEIEVKVNETDYIILIQRYKEIEVIEETPPGDTSDDVPYDLVGYITEIDTGKIDADYMNSRFDKYFKLLRQDEVSDELLEQALNELHKSFASLNQEEQKYANIFLHDIQRGDIVVEEGKTFRDYVTEYQFNAKNDQIHRFSEIFGLNEELLRSMMGLKLNESNINEFGRLDDLKKTIDKGKAKLYFEMKEGIKLNPPKVNIRTDKLIRDFILSGGFEVDN